MCSLEGLWGVCAHACCGAVTAVAVHARCIAHASTRKGLTAHSNELNIIAKVIVEGAGWGSQGYVPMYPTAAVVLCLKGSLKKTIQCGIP